jgi:hypothetical protein
MSRIETFLSAFRTDPVAGAALRRIEIPLIQRDYAQGRRSVKTDEIRETFLGVLFDALVGEDPQPVSLDFIYGEISHGTLRPLDGQQRLTTLFLLHWYVAARADTLDSSASWTRFSYATRQSARRFCERLVENVPPKDVHKLSAWIMDQPWYLFVWRHDPTIQAMLVMVDAIHDHFAAVDARVVWERLADAEQPAVSFHLLPLPDMGSAEDLYIKMNSRGKPLTDFENFKAHFEKTIESSPRAAEFARKVDVEWSDVLWNFRGDDGLFDEEFLRYLEFVTEVCEWSDPILNSTSQLPFVQRTERIFGKGNPAGGEHLDFMFSAFDAWVGRDVSSTFGIFSGRASDSSAKLPLFFRTSDVNLFEACCRSYGQRGAANRLFTFGQTLLLIAVLLHITHKTEDFPRRVRVLRNLIEGSTFEMRAERMPRLVADTKALILSGRLPEPGNGFSLPQIDDEKAKEAFCTANPRLRTVLNDLEDHVLLRGSLNAFELDAGKVEQRAEVFRQLIGAEDLWSDAAGALLTVGDYQRARGRDPLSTRSFQFATPDKQNREVWRLILTGATRDALKPTSRVFAGFLDTIAESAAPFSETMSRMHSAWLKDRELIEEFDWRYYMVKYAAMREGGSGIYFADGGTLGYSLCNLRGGMKQMNSLYRDPYLLTIWRELSETPAVEDPWFIGYEWNPRWLRLAASGVGVRSVASGFELSGPVNADFQRVFDAALADYGVGSDLRLTIKQSAVGNIDAENRILVGKDLVRYLLDRGL